MPERVVGNRTRRVMLGLTIVTLLLTGWCGYQAGGAAYRYKQAEAECEKLDTFAFDTDDDAIAAVVFDDVDWVGVCHDALDTGSTALGAVVLGVFAFGWFVLAVTFFLIFITRPKYKTEVTPR